MNNLSLRIHGEIKVEKQLFYAESYTVVQNYGSSVEPIRYLTKT